MAAITPTAPTGEGGVVVFSLSVGNVTFVMVDDLLSSVRNVSEKVDVNKMSQEHAEWRLYHFNEWRYGEDYVATATSRKIVNCVCARELIKNKRKYKIK